MNKVPIEDHSRVIVHLDIDAFYAQVEENIQPELKTKPLGVYQKTIIVTSNYVAREYGIKKCMLTTEAIKLCPNLVLVNGENLEKYRQVSQNITQFIQEKYKVPVEKLGFDENFVDVTKLVEETFSTSANSTEVNKNLQPCREPDGGNISDEDDFSMIVDEKSMLGNQNPKKRKSEDSLKCNENVHKKLKLISFEDKETLSVVDFHSKTKVVGHVYKDIEGKCACGCIIRIIRGTQIANDIRENIFKEYNLTLSAGISCNKLLSKLVGSLHKPNQQTVIFPNAALDLMSGIHLRQIPGIGRKMVEKLANNLNIKTVENLQNATRADLCKTFDASTADWLLNVAYGRDSSQVKNFCKQSSIGVEDRYAKPITSLNDFIKECKVLLTRLLVLIRKDGRTPKLLKIHLRFDHFKFEFKLDSKQCQINTSIFSNPDPNQIETHLMDVIVKMYKELCVKRNSHTITYINLAFGNFVEIPSSENSILKFCLNQTFQASREKTLNDSNLESSSTSNSKTSCLDKNEHVKNIDMPSIPSAPRSSSIHTDRKITNPSNGVPNTVSQKETTSTSTPAHESNTQNTLDIDNIDPEVLSELPEDIRKEIELELSRNRRKTDEIITHQNEEQKTVNHAKKVTEKRKTVKQLSMLNFVQKK